MAFPVQPSTKKKKRILSRRRKSGDSYANYQRERLTTVLPDANQAVEDATPPSASSNTRKDDNWRSNRAVKSAKRETAKAIAELNTVKVDIATTKSQLQAANGRVKQVEHEQYLGKKESRVHALKTEEEHQFSFDQLSAKFYEELEAANKVAAVETTKRLAEEAKRIVAENNHSRLLRGERQHYTDKAKRKQEQLEKERHGHQLQIDHLHNQWKQKIAASTANLKRENAARAAIITKEMNMNAQKSEEILHKETTKLINKLEKNVQKSEETLEKTKTKLMNKLEKKEQMLDLVKDGNKER